MNRRRLLACLTAVGAAGTALVGVMPGNTATATTTAVTTSTVAASNKPALDRTRITFGSRVWACRRDGQGCGVHVIAPRDWKYAGLSLYHAKFYDRSRTWMLRIDAGLSGKDSTATAAKRKERALRGVRNLRIISRVSGTVSSAFPSTQRISFTTLTYTYTDAARGTRWVSTQYVDPYADGKSAFFEITVGGRVKDQAGLRFIQTRAARTIYLAG